MACLVLAVLAVVGASYVVHSANAMAVGRSRTLALAAANSRMEELCILPYNTLAGMISTSGVAWVMWDSGSGWVSGSNETFSAGDGTYPLQTRLTAGGDRLTLTVWAGYRANPTDMIRLDSVRAPTD